MSNRRVFHAAVVAILMVLGCHPNVPPGQSGASGARPHVEFPNTPPGIALARWLDAYNTGRVDSMEAALRVLYAAPLLERRSAAMRAQSLRVWWRNYGALHVARFDTVRTASIVATVHEELTDGWGMLFFDVDSLPPHGITGVGLVPFQEPPDWTQLTATSSDAALTKRLGQLAQRLTAADAFAGVVLVIRDGRPLLRRACGFANRERSVPNTPETAFELASTSKMFTAVAVAQLAERGLLSFSDPVSKLLPDLPARRAAALVTLHHLLTMTSGFPDLFRSPRYWKQREEIRALSDYWQFFATDSLEFEPGTQWSYSNSNFLLLGSIVERVSGMPFAEYVARHIFEPAGMRHTAYRSGSVPERARGYTRVPTGSPPGTPANPDHWYPVVMDTTSAQDVGAGGPAGGGDATVDDLGAFAQALLAHRLLRAETTRQLIAGYVATEYGGLDGYGFETRTWNGVKIVGHGGAFSGVSTQVDIYPELGYVVVVLSNLDASGAQALANHARVLIAAGGNRSRR
jgi:D-alanyl-D-alanine carboxypeptidase